MGGIRRDAVVPSGGLGGDDAALDPYAAMIRAMPLGAILCRVVEPHLPGTYILLDANPAASALMGRELLSYRGRPLGEIFDRGDPGLSQHIGQIVATGRAQTIPDLSYTDAQLAPRHFRSTVVPLPGGLVGFVFEDMTAQRRAEGEVVELTLFLESIVENIPDMVFVKDAKELRFERFNRAGEDFLGRSRNELLGKSDYDLFPREQADFFTSKDREVIDGGRLVEIPEEEIQTTHGPRWLHTKKIPILDAVGRPRHLLGISEDITEKKRAAEELRRAHEELERRVEERTRELQLTHEQLRHAQKMEAVGQLAGGIAHDFNNVLSVLMSYTEMILGEVGPGSPLRGDLEEMKKAGERAATLTHQLLAFSRQQVMRPRRVDLNEVIAAMGRMLRRILGEDVELRVLLDPALGRVHVDANQIEQVIMNLALNARDAMPNGGSLTIETSNVELDEGYAREHHGTIAGPHVMVAVSDTGVGMDRATQARIFEPFFTTKEVGKGTGLGLSTAFGIVRQSGGSIWVYSEPGDGSTFKVYLPRTEGAADPRASQAEPASLRGAETILLVEDEEQVRVLARTILKRQGYRVLEARNAGDALLLHEAFHDVIHLLVTDVVMPRVNGPKLAERLRAERPDLKVLYVSGYAGSAIVERGVLEAGAAFLQKPLTPDALSRRVREVLDAGRGPASAR